MAIKIMILLLEMILSSVGYSLIAPLFPNIAHEVGIDDMMLGIIFSAFAVANVTVIPFSTCLISWIGRKRLFYIALFIEATCTTSYGFLVFIKEKQLMTIAAFLLRFMQGVGSALSSTLIYSIAASVSEKDEVNKVLGYIELGYSVGLTIGPLCASVLYYVGGYSLSFYFFGCIMMLSIISLSYLEINESANEEEEEEPTQNFFCLIFNKRIILIFLAIVIDMVTTTFYYPILSSHLKNKYGYGVEVSSIFFVISMSSYFVILQVLSFINGKLGVVLTILLGLFINITCSLLLPPIDIFYQGSITIIIGLIILGMTGVLIAIPGIIELMTVLKLSLKFEEDAANDMSSALFNFAINLGEVIGPVIGGSISNAYDFSTACVTISATNLMFGVLFLIFNYKYIANFYYGQEVERQLKYVELSEYQSLRNRSLRNISGRGALGGLNTDEFEITLNYVSKKRRANVSKKALRNIKGMGTYKSLGEGNSGILYSPSM